MRVYPVDSESYTVGMFACRTELCGKAGGRVTSSSTLDCSS